MGRVGSEVGAGAAKESSGGSSCDAAVMFLCSFVCRVTMTHKERHIYVYIYIIYMYTYINTYIYV